jgi:UDP-3-O-[3-hydroxymyristoyl] glucosamine N-acyltransferase
MKVTVAELASRLGGQPKGELNRIIEGAAGLLEATEKDLSFLSNPKYETHLAATKAGAVLVSPDIPVNGQTVIVVKNPHFAWGQVLSMLEKERLRHPQGVHPTAVVAPSAKIGTNVVLGAYAVVEENASIGDNTVLYAHVYIGRDTVIGKDCLLYPNVTFRERVKVGDRCIFQPGVVIGGDGYGFSFNEGRHHKVPQIGTVEIGDDVEIQANATVDRGAVGPTKIGNGTKVDNLVQIAHGVEIGNHCLIVAQCGIAGSVKIGDYAVLAAQVGVAGHLTIGDQVKVGARGGVTKNLAPRQDVWGTPAQPLRDELKSLASIRRLPSLFEDVKAIKKKLEMS